jgi:hypothetical protein
MSWRRRCRLTGVKVAVCHNFCATRQQIWLLRAVQRLNGNECYTRSETCQFPDVNKTAIRGRNLLFQEFQILRFEEVISECMQVSFPLHFPAFLRETFCSLSRNVLQVSASDMLSLHTLALAQPLTHKHATSYFYTSIGHRIGQELRRMSRSLGGWW